MPTMSCAMALRLIRTTWRGSTCCAPSRPTIAATCGWRSITRPLRSPCTDGGAIASGRADAWNGSPARPCTGIACGPPSDCIDGRRPLTATATIAFVLPTIPVSTRNGLTHPEGIGVLREIVERRARLAGAAALNRLERGQLGGAHVEHLALTTTATSIPPQGIV